jgi:hypothetical protein
VVLEAPAGNLSLSIGLCTFVYEEPKEAKSVVRAEAESTTVSALSVFFPSNEVFVFYELRERQGKRAFLGQAEIDLRLCSYRRVSWAQIKPLHSDMQCV